MPKLLLPLSVHRTAFMRKLQEIVRVIGRRRLKRIEVFNDGGRGLTDNLYYKLYKGIKDGRFKSDEDAARELFDCEPTNKRYLMLKSRVRTRLINTLFFLENSTSRYQQAVYHTNRNLVAAKLLLLNGARSTGIAMLKSTLHEAEKYSVTEVAVESLRILRYQSSFLGRETDFKKYNQRFQEKKEILQAEWRAEECYQMVTIPFAKSSSVKSEVAEMANNFVEEVTLLRENNYSFNMELLYFRLVIMRDQIIQDHEGVINACIGAQNFLDSHQEMDQKVRYGEFAVYRIIAYLNLRKYDEGTLLARRILPLFREGTTNWVIFLEYYFLLSMHCGNYQKSIEICQNVMGHPRFEHLAENRREKWKIFEGFLKYMTGNVNFHDEQHMRGGATRFNIWKFLNEVPIYSKDKRGLNISILILQVLFLLDRQDYDGIISRAEALKVYCSRYLKRDEHFRSNCFLKMVLIMEKKGFDHDQTEKIAEKYFDKLRSARFNYRGGLNTMEIIPYENLWNSILMKLKQ